jgi:bifunctional non-homologous end joining protein LigD
MSLDRYWSKRDFERTSEPRGERPWAAPSPERRFVVQRHRARRLHYDFRLEIGGVLVSWAVPRGPSMRPLERRMAARTEDHPMEYLDFEGVIPAGEYGAGDVIVWDRGTWEPETLGDPVIDVQTGELKLILHGERLRGRFVLVRTSKDATKEDWLLIHKDDEHADRDWDIDTLPTSVRTGRTNEDVLLGRDPVLATTGPPSIDEIDLSAAVEARMPEFISPMLATPVDQAFSSPAWLFEMKLDGYRLEAVVHDGRVQLWTRNRKDAATYFPAFAASRTAWLAGYDAIVDGEMVALDPEGRPSFSLLQDLSGLRGIGAHRGERRGASADEAEAHAQEAGGSLVYHAFDLLHLDGRDLLAVPLEERKKLLRLVIREHPAARYVTHVLEHGTEFQEAVVGQQLEGSIAKLRTSRYEPGRRTRSWLKIKARREQELVVVGYEPGKGSHADLGALLVATREGSAWRYAGEVGSGLDGRTRTLMRHLLDEHAIDEPPVDDPPPIRGVRWSEPRHVIRALFTEWTTDGLLRQASFKGREMGRDPRSVSRERVEPAGEARARAVAHERRTPVAEAAAPVSATRSKPGRGRVPAGEGRRGTRRAYRPGTEPPVAAMTLVRTSPDPSTPARAVTAAELQALRALGTGGRWEVGGHRLDLTNLDKPLFPRAGLTKRDLIIYFTTISPVILPYLEDRPLNVNRWPDGIEGRTRFWQKQIPSHAPSWVARWDYPEAGHDQSHTYVVADRVATMAWLANQAVIDLHPWTSRAADHTRPTYAYIDIDPGDTTTWPEVVTLARLYHTALRHLGMRGHPKLTGQRGLQIWVPVEPRYTFDETREWVRELSYGVGAVVPDLVSWEWGKADRRGRARLDYTQNAIIKTLVAPYAVRPVANAAVSAPITWDELDDADLRPDAWDIHTIVGRVEQVGDLFSGVLDDPQVLPPLS